MYSIGLWMMGLQSTHIHLWFLLVFFFRSPSFNTIEAFLQAVLTAIDSDIPFTQHFDPFVQAYEAHTEKAAS